MHFEVYCILFLYLWLFVSVIIQMFCLFKKNNTVILPKIYFYLISLIFLFKYLLLIK